MHLKLLERRELLLIYKRPSPLTKSRRAVSSSLQNRRIFLRILGEHRRKRGEREARVACEGKSDFLRFSPRKQLNLY